MVGSKNNPPLWMYYPKKDSFSQPEIIINGKKLFSPTNVAACWYTYDESTCDFEIGEDSLDDPDYFDQDYNLDETHLSSDGKNLIRMRSSYQLQRTPVPRTYYLSSGGFNLLRGGTIAALNLQGTNWTHQDQRSRRLNIDLEYLDVREFDDDWPVTKNKNISKKTAIKRPDTVKAVESFAAQSFRQIDATYKDTEDFCVTDEKSLGEINKLLNEYHKDFSQATAWPQPPPPTKDHQGPPKTRTPSPTKVIRGMSVRESDATNPIAPHEWVQSNSGNGRELVINLRHPNIRSWYSKGENQIAYIVEQYAIHMADGNLEKFQEISTDLQTRFFPVS